jgi:uncharacterized cupredoxin-like copper-binding protein
MRRSFLLAALFLAAPANAAGPDWGTAQEVEVRLTSFAFEPARIELVAGRAYVLRLINPASGGHNFHAKTFFAAAQIAPADQVHVRKGAVEVPGQQTVEVRLVAPAAGRYELDCSHFLHDSFGMNGEIVVAAQ